MLGRLLRVGAVAGVAAALLPLTGAIAATAPTRPPAPSCPVLVVSALPLEIDPILAHSKVNPTPVWVDSYNKGFWSGTAEGNKAIFAMTGIGLENAAHTTQAAFAHFGCFSAVVFSGTSGGDFIGDVMAPARWTEDGKHFVTTSSITLGVLKLALGHPIPLEQTTPVGDPFCPCQSTTLPSATTPIAVDHKPQVEVGGTALSNDGFGGRALPCIPSGNDVLGCWPCPFPDTATAAQAQDLASTVPPFLQPSFFLDYGSASAAPPGTYVSEDMETAAVFAIAAAHGVPFIGFRAASDGGGDPLHLPGFPAEFFVYRQLAADNAASTALAFLAEWHLVKG